MVGVASTCTPSMDTQKGVRAVLGVVYVKAGVRAVARHVATICAEKPPTTIMERCALARCLDWLDNRMPGAFLHLPIYLQLFYLTRKVGIMEALESNNETALVEALSSRSAAVMAENLAAEGVPVAEDCLSELLAEPGTDEAFDAETDYVERDAEAACRSVAHNVADSAEITVDDIEQALLAEETGNQMETYHWTNPFPDGSEPEEQVPEQAPEPKEEHPIEEQPQRTTVVDFYKKSDGTSLELVMKGVAELQRQSGKYEAFTHLVTCDSHKNKRWVIAAVSDPVPDDNDTVEAYLMSFARKHGMLEVPFVVGVSDHVPEMLVLYQSPESDKHKAKRLAVAKAALFSYAKTGGQSLKVVETTRCVMQNCRVYLSNLEIRQKQRSADAVSDMDYETALATVMGWGTDKFTAFVENAKLKVKRTEPLSDLEATCLTCKATLLENVKLRQDADDIVFHINTEKQRAACPKDLVEGATDYAKRLEIVLWQPERQNFNRMSLEQWLDTEEHLLSSLIILGPGGLGKSKLMHMLAKEICVAYDKEVYIFGKALDPLGVLSHCGVVRQCAVLALTDFDLKARKGALSAEEIKSLFDVVEGGSVQQTGYRPAMFPPGLCRLFALNGSGADIGLWFEKGGMYGIATTARHLEKNDLEAAAEMVKTLDTDQQAQMRRFALCMPTQSLITGATVVQLREDARAKAASGLARRHARYSQI